MITKITQSTQPMLSLPGLKVKGPQGKLMRPHRAGTNPKENETTFGQEEAPNEITNSERRIIMAANHPSSSGKNWLKIGIIAFAVQGSWTLWANWGHGLEKAAPSALMQGIFSGISASIMTLLMDMLFRLIRPSRLRPPICIMLTSISMVCVLTALHFLIGTPEILKTLLLPCFAIAAYAVGYTSHLQTRDACSRLSVSTRETS